MDHNLDDWKETAKIVDGNIVIDCSPLRWYNDDGNPLSPSELISLGYWGIRPSTIPPDYNPEINKLEEVDINECEKDLDKQVIIRSYRVINLFESEIAQIQREKRNELLKKTDKLVYPDLWEDLPEEKKQKIKEYRKNLRDVPQQSGFPREIDWPLPIGIFYEEQISSEPGSVTIFPIENP